MKRADLESRFIEILSAGGEPMDDREIRDAVEADAELAAELEQLRDFVLKMDDMEWPEVNAAQGIDHITEAFDEGFRQGRTQAAAATERSPWLGRIWQFAAATAVAVFVGVVGGSYVINSASSNEQVAQLQNDMQGLQELVAVSMLESERPSQRLLGLQRTRDVSNPSAKLIDAMASTLRSDQNDNVKLAAADAIVRYADHPEVVNALHETVMSEGPFMQAELIDVLLIVRTQETKALFNQLAASPEVSEVVRIKAIAAADLMKDI